MNKIKRIVGVVSAVILSVLGVVPALAQAQFYMPKGNVVQTVNGVKIITIAGQTYSYNPATQQFVTGPTIRSSTGYAPYGKSAPKR